MRFSSEEEYHKDIRKKLRQKKMDEVDGCVEESIIGMMCDCGKVDTFKQKRRGSFLIICTACEEEFYLEE